MNSPTSALKEIWNVTNKVESSAEMITSSSKHLNHVALGETVWTFLDLMVISLVNSIAVPSGAAMGIILLLLIMNAIQDEEFIAGEATDDLPTRND